MEAVKKKKKKKKKNKKVKWGLYGQTHTGFSNEEAIFFMI